MTRDYRYRHEIGHEYVDIAVEGRDVQSHPLINFGTAFTAEDRDKLKLHGLLPAGISNIHEQVRRQYEEFKEQPDNFAKYMMLSMLRDRNEVLYYRLITEHIGEMMPIIYTPTIGQAIQEYSQTFHRPRGTYLDINHPELIEEALLNNGLGPNEVDLIVATDSEGILGIGDWGVGGIAITIGKLSLYTAAAGVHPARVMAVGLDTGTNNLTLLNDDSYLGVRQARVRGQQYDDFIDQFTRTAHRLFPNAMLHWEDFSAANAHRILERYRNDICAFNDDIQGTAAVVVAAVEAAVRRTGSSLEDARVVVYGAGTAGVGIADLLIDGLVTAGVDRKEAYRHFWALGSRGLIVEGDPMRDFQEPFARPASEVESWNRDAEGHISLEEVIRQVQPTILIGTSGQPGTFTEQVVTTMAVGCEKPIIMPLSNPTDLAEATPEDLLRWTDGKALIATGSPFDPVEYKGTTYTIAQANNAFVFPGIGLGVIVTHARRISDRMIRKAAEALARFNTDISLGSSLLPTINDLRLVSASIAIEVAQAAIDEKLARRIPHNLVSAVHESMWRPDYPEVVKVDSLQRPDRASISQDSQAGLL